MLSLSIKNNDGFTIGPDIVIKFCHDKGEGSSGCNVCIQAPRNLNISRVDNMTIRQIADRLQQAGREARRE